MKICMIFPTYPPNYQTDGIGDYTRILVNRIREKGHDVYVVSSGRYAGKDDRVIKVGGGRWGWRELIKVFKRVRREQFDVVHMQYTPVSYGFGITFKLLPLFIRISAHDIRFVVTFHTVTGGRWISRINALLLAVFSHRIISTNEEITQLIDKWLGFCTRKLTQIPIGANITSEGPDHEAAREMLLRKYGIRKDSVILSNFGFTYPGKGFEDIIAALGKVRERDRYYLVIIGALRDEDAAYRHALQGRIRMKGLEKNVIWTGEVGEEKASSLLKASDIYVVPYSEGINIRRGSLMAGIVNALPIISTRPRVDVPYFRDGENVVLVDRDDPDGLSSAIERVAGDKALREKLSANIRTLADEFDWDKIADRTIGVYSRRA